MARGACKHRNIAVRQELKTTGSHRLVRNFLLRARYYDAITKQWVCSQDPNLDGHGTPTSSSRQRTLFNSIPT